MSVFGANIGKTVQFPPKRCFEGTRGNAVARPPGAVAASAVLASLWRHRLPGFRLSAVPNCLPVVPIAVRGAEWRDLPNGIDKYEFADFSKELSDAPEEAFEEIALTINANTDAKHIRIMIEGTLLDSESEALD